MFLFETDCTVIFVHDIHFDILVVLFLNVCVSVCTFRCKAWHSFDFLIYVIFGLFRTEGIS